MCIVIDIVLLIIFAASVFLGWRRGFIRSVMHLVSFVLAIAAAVVFAPKLTPVYESRITPVISDAISVQIDKISEETENVNIGELINKTSEALSGIIDRIDLSSIENYISEISDKKSENEPNELLPDSDENTEDTSISSEELTESKKEIADYMAGPISEKISYMLAFMTVFLIAIVVFKIITCILDSVFKLPLLKGLNKSAGLLFGMLIGLVWVYVISMALTAVLPILVSLRPDIFSFDLNDSIIIGFINAFIVK